MGYTPLNFGYSNGISPKDYTAMISAQTRSQNSQMWTGMAVNITGSLLNSLFTGLFSSLASGDAQGAGGVQGGSAAGAASPEAQFNQATEKSGLDLSENQLKEIESGLNFQSEIDSANSDLTKFNNIEVLKQYEAALAQRDLAQNALNKAQAEVDAAKGPALELQTTIDVGTVAGNTQISFPNNCSCKGSDETVPTLADCDLSNEPVQDDFKKEDGETLDTVAFQKAKKDYEANIELYDNAVNQHKILKQQYDDGEAAKTNLKQYTDKYGEDLKGTTFLASDKQALKEAETELKKAADAKNGENGPTAKSLYDQKSEAKGKKELAEANMAKYKKSDGTIDSAKIAQAKKTIADIRKINGQLNGMLRDIESKETAISTMQSQISTKQGEQSKLGKIMSATRFDRLTNKGKELKTGSKKETKYNNRIAYDKMQGEIDASQGTISQLQTQKNKLITDFTALKGQRDAKMQQLQA